MTNGDDVDLRTERRESMGADLLDHSNGCGACASR
jgi:hypothetical protein